MQHISDIMAEPPPTHSPAVWQRAADAAYAIARGRARNPASLRQLRRVCQLLMSHTLQESERRRAVTVLMQGCTHETASAMLRYLTPRVQARKAREAQAFLRTLLCGCASPEASRRSAARSR